MTQTLTTEMLQEIYEAAVHSEASGSQEAEFELLCKLEDVGGTSATIRKLIDLVRAANREAQPVAIGEVRLGQRDDVGCFSSARVICLHEQADWDNFPDGTKLYTATPAPAVPEEMPEIDRGEGGSDIDYMQPQEIYDMGKTDGWNSCRAAMLAQPVSQGYKLVPVEPTPKQWAAGVKVMDTGIDKVTLVYKAMLAAAPEGGE